MPESGGGAHACLVTLRALWRQARPTVKDPKPCPLPVAPCALVYSWRQRFAVAVVFAGAQRDVILTRSRADVCVRFLVFCGVFCLSRCDCETVVLSHV